MDNDIDKVLSASALRSMAGNLYYSRGMEYYQDGCVGTITETADSIAATVTGTHCYRVKLSAVDGVLQGSCNCPLGRDGLFCKHQVALGLARLHSQKENGRKKRSSKFDWHKFIKSCSREEVEKILFEMSPHCPKIVEKYRMENLPFTEDALAMELKEKINTLAGIAEDCGYFDDDYDYDGEDRNEDFCDGQKQLETALNRIEDNGNYKLLFKIAEYGIEKIRQTSTCKEEPVSLFLDSMLDYCFRAFRYDACSSEYLIEKIMIWENNNSYCGFSTLEHHFSELPESVQMIWFEKAVEQWNVFPVLKMGENDHNYYRRRLEERLLAIAEKRKDFDLILSVRERNQCSDDDVLNLAEEYRKRKMSQKILPLLKEAHRIFPRSIEVRDALTAEQQKQGNHEDAMKIAWKDFEASPLSDEKFHFLLKTAEKAKCRPETIEKILNFLSQYELSKEKVYSFWENGSSVRARRVEILLELGRQETAWDLGRDADIGERLKLRLADWRSQKNPEDSAAICNQLLERALRPTGDDAYAHVVELLCIYRKYLEAAGKPSQFQQYCQWIKTEFKRRRKLVELMTHHHL